MNQTLTLVIEDEQGEQQQAQCAKVAIIWQGKELWLQPVGNQLMIGVDMNEGDTEYANLLLRPMATNLVSLELEMEAADPDEVWDDGHVHGPDCQHD
ncbi:MAG: topoisomerase II [Thiopseudomonas sp.]|nr:topoisomerase II [Gammaproteobacteria bacterium]